jgi:hypothetical protein
MEERRIFGGNVAAWATILFTMMLSAVSATYTFAILSGRVDRAASDISEMKQAGRDSANTLSEIDRRTARMETKLEILLPTATVKELEARR